MTAPTFVRIARRSIAALALLACAAPTLADAAPPAFESCTIGGDAASLRAECATLSVPVDPERPDGASLALALARVAARGRQVAADPLVFIAGGPGQAARDTFASVATAFAEAGRTRDVLLVDQRGTGDSHPLDCGSTDAAGPTLAGPTGEGRADDDPTAVGTRGARPEVPDEGKSRESSAARIVADAVRESTACLAGLDADPALFTTSVAVADLERVRAALGIERWNLYGVSYGTRVAMHYARRHPARVRTLLLDGVVPPGTPLGADIAPHAQRALDAVFARCAAEPGCSAAFPDIAARTRELIGTLAAKPAQVVREDIATGRLDTGAFTREDLAATLRLLSYSAWGASILPSMLHDAVEDSHLAPLARQAAMQSRALDTVLATGMHHAVVCTEDLPFTDVEAAATAAADTYLGATPIRALAAACRPWPAGRLDPDFHAPLELDTPALVLSGDADPVTPPAFGEGLLAGLPNARHIVDPGQGHMQAPLGCMPSVMARFLDSADATGLDVGCLERLAPPPFFIDANGPRP